MYIPTNPKQEQHHEDQCCETNINIENKGTINIYNCVTIPGKEPAPLPELPQECPPALPPGDCVPLTTGHKPKKNLEGRLRHLLTNNQVPSVLAASFFQMARRFLAGKDPANSLESRAFEILRNLSSQAQDVMACSLQTFDALPPRDRKRLFAPQLFHGVEAPVDPSELIELFSAELRERASLEAFEDIVCIDDTHPGQPRPVDLGEFGIDLAPRICRIRTPSLSLKTPALRTNDFKPPLRIGEFRPNELQQQCSLEFVDPGTPPRLNCRNQTEPCPGNAVDSVCLRVQEVRAGDVVILEGYNFFSIEAKVRLEAQTPGTTRREVESHVCGDLATPVSEIVDGVEKTIADCRVRDILTFQIPEDLPEGIYAFRVIVPNNTGNGDPELRSRDQFLRVIPPETARFQIASEKLIAVEVTDGPGSDEVGLQIIAATILPDYSVMTPLAVHRFPIFEEIDTARDVVDERDMNRVLFQNSEPIGGVAMFIIGYEVDDEDVYEEQIQEYQDAFVAVLQSEWQVIADSIGVLGAAIAAAAGAGPWAAAIGAAIAFGVLVFVALWAPADLIIEDVAAFLPISLGELTSANFPAPSRVEFTSPGGIRVIIEPISKDVQYRESRHYRSEEEDSRYTITLRYNRLV